MTPLFNTHRLPGIASRLRAQVRAAAALAVAGVLGMLVPTCASAGVQVAGIADTIVVAKGAVFTAAIAIPVAGDAFNAFNLSVRFDPAQLTFVPAAGGIAAQVGPLIKNAAPSLFHRFTATPDSLKVDLSLLGNGLSVTGPGVIYTLSFRAGNTDGFTTLLLGEYTRFFFAGSEVAPLEKRAIVVQTGAPVLGVAPPAGGGQALAFAAPYPAPATSGAAMGLRFTLPHATSVAFEMLDTLGRRVATRPAQRFAAGAQTLSWRIAAVPPGRYTVILRTAGGAQAARGWTVLR